MPARVPIERHCRRVVEIRPDRAARSGTRSRRAAAPTRSCATSSCARCTRRAARRRDGWRPQYLLLGAGALVAAMPLYLKAHSYGEYVFDWAWADAYHRHGLRVLPEAALRRAVHAGARPAPARVRRGNASAAAGAAALAREAKLSSVHLLFLVEDDRRARRGRHDDARTVQFHWRNGAGLRRLRRLPRQPAARQAQEDPAGAPQSRRSGITFMARRAPRSARPTGTSSTAATRAPTASITRRPTSRSNSSCACGRRCRRTRCSSSRCATVGRSPHR